MTPEQARQIMDQYTPAEITRWIGSGAFAEPLAEYLMLTGIKIGRGDLMLALQALGLLLCRNDDAGTRPPDAEDRLSQWFRAADQIISPVWAELREEGRCPRCGLPRYRLRDSARGWWHVRDNSDWGYQRRCWSSEIISQLPDEERAARDAFLASRH